MAMMKPRTIGTLSLAAAIWALPAFAPAAQAKRSPTEDFLDRLEARMQNEVTVARSDQADNRKTLDESQALLSRAQAAQNMTAVTGAQRAVDLAQKALAKNRLREQRAQNALGWIARLKREAATARRIGAFMTRADGEVTVEPKEGGPPRSITGDEPPVAQPGDTVRTGKDGNAGLFLPDGSDISVGAGSAVMLAEDGLQLFFGQIKAEVKHKLAGKFEVRTPSAVTSVRGTEFVVRELPGKPSSVIVLRGTVAFSDIKGTKTVLVNAGQQSYILPDGTPAEPTRANIQEMPRWWEK